MRCVVICLSFVVSVAAQQSALREYGRLPLVFEPNQGQTDSSVRFLARTAGGTLFLTEGEAMLGPVRMRLAGSHKPQAIHGLEPTGGISNYFIGNDPAKWRTRIPHYGRVEYKSVYAGVDLVYYGNPQKLEYDLVVAPGADPRAIQVEYEGAESLRVDKDGDLVLKTAVGELRQKRPIAYQETANGRVEVEVGYRLKGRRVAFELARYDTGRRLVIDPVLLYSTYLGSSLGDQGSGIAVDGSGNAYVTGFTGSTNFPTTNPLQASNGGGFDAFVTKINNAGSTLLYSTYLGGSGEDEGQAIAVDGTGNVHVTGWTTSSNLPTTNPLQASNGGGEDAFVAKINAAGSARVYSTYLGGNGTDIGNGIAVDGSGNAYVTGWTTSSNLPTTNPLQASNGGGQDAFVTKINAAGSARVYSTYLGGSLDDRGNGIAVDGSGNAYVMGWTASTNFPTTNPLQASNGGNGDGFVTKINAAGSARVYSTYLGGSLDDRGNGIAVDGSGNAYVTGFANSTNFPTSISAVGPSNAGNSDGFVSSISGNAPVGMFRDSSGTIQLTSELSTLLSSAGGVFASDPSASQNKYGDTFVVARDSSNSVWLNVYDARTRTFDGWTPAGGVVQGVPAVAAIDNTAYLIARDPSNAYWTNVFTRGTGFAGWVNRGGAFATDPAVGKSLSCCLLYLVGKDNFNAIWTSTWYAGFTPPSAWQLQGAVAVGNPWVAFGTEGAAYIAIRDPSNAVWMGRLNAFTFNGWQPGGGTVATDPQVAWAGNNIYAAVLTSNGGVWYNTFIEGTGNNWTSWVNTGGTLSSVSAAASSGPQLFLTGRDGTNQLWWYETPGVGWKFVGAGGVAAGPLSAAPR